MFCFIFVSEPFDCFPVSAHWEKSGKCCTIEKPCIFTSPNYIKPEYVLHTRSMLQEYLNCVRVNNMSLRTHHSLVMLHQHIALDIQLTQV